MVSNNNLSGLSILVTRPQKAGVLLKQALEESGADVILFPTIAFAEPPSLDVLMTGIEALPEQDWIIFVSPYAVQRFVQYTDQYLDRHSLSARYAAIGDGTAHALASAGIKQVLHPKSDMTSEGLLSLPEFHAITNQKIAIARGVSGREMLDRELSARGAHILPLVLYQRVVPEEDASLLITFLNQKRIHVILSASFDSVFNLCQLVGNHPSLKAVPLVVMSERVKALAAELGFSTVWVENVADHERTVHFLYEKRTQLCQMNNNKQ